MSNKWLCLRIFAGIVGLAAAGEGYAAVVDSGVELTSKQTYLIGAGSTVTHTPSSIVIIDGSSTDQPTPLPPQPQTYELTGKFDIEVYRYWWQYETSPGGGTAEYTELWAALTNAELHGAESLAGFELPHFLMRFSGENLIGSDGPCSGPMGPDTYCTGFSNGFPSSVSGTLQDDALQLDGWIPHGFYVSEGYSYHINAVAAVPLPPAFALLASSIVALLGWSRRYA